MRGVLLLCAALAAAAASPPPPPDFHTTIDHIKAQILAKLGLSSRPTPVGAPPRDVVRRILQHASDETPQPVPDTAMREVIAIAHRDSCQIGCNGSPTGAAFLSGHKYNYGVEGTVAVYLTGADKQETSVRVLSQVSVTATGNCVHELKVQQLVISGPDGKKYSSPTGIDKPIRFTIQDGRVGAEICTEPDDTRRSLNIKRAIVSLLQNDQKSSTFVDVFGACPTDVSSSKEGAFLLVHQTRDLSRCAHREQAKDDLMTAIYNPTAEIKDTQVLQSTMHIESKVNNGVPEKVAATEEYLYRPFSVGENGARAKVLTKLTLTGKSAGAASGAACTERHSIIFEKPHGVPTPNNAESALQAVKDTASKLTTEANSESAGVFVQLIRILRSTNNDDLKKVFNQVKGNSLERRVFLDGLLRTGTGDSIEASIEILKGKELSPFETSLVYLSLGNAQHVDNEAVKAGVGLLDISNVPKEIYLGVGALAGAYCREHNCHDGKSDGVKALSQKLSSKLNCKAKSKIEEDKMVAILKGIRNIRHLEDSIIDKLVHCAIDKDVRARVKVAALEAFHADPCSNKIHKTAMDVMKNRQLDSEIRIKAYLAVIECPCSKSASEIKILLENEEIHQVGRFITTSLRHIRTSANPDKRLARQHYGQIRTPNKFNVDDRKYSFYREASFNVDALGLGGNIEQSVIYSQNSFVPRSASLNLTTELFGHNLNIFEIGGRQGNLDSVLEHFFGPNSDIRTKDAQTLYDNFMKKWQESSQKVQDGLSRGKRSVKSEVDHAHKNMKGDSPSFHNELDLDVYLKLFGTDAVFLSLGDDKGLDLNKLIDQALKYTNDGINKAKHFQQELRAHLLFLDAELTYPTSVGFPLKLGLYGAATGRLDISTNLDIRQIFKNPESAKVDIKLIPSVNIQLIGAFVVDADAVVTGLKVDTSLHSSTGAHIIAKVLEHGRGFDLQLGLPIDKQEILSASTELVFVTADKGKKPNTKAINVDTDRKEGHFCFDQMSGILGQVICGNFSVPFSVSGPEAQASLSKFIARFPLTGPANVKLTLIKEDLRGYHIKGVLRNDNNGERRGFELLFDAEGSKNRRTQLTGELVNSKQEKTLLLGLESPLKTVSGQVSLYTKPNEFALLVKGKLDANEYYGKVGFNIQGNEKRSVFKPVAEYKLPDDHGKQSLKVEGQVVKEVNGPVTKYSLEGVKVNMPNSNDKIDINGHYTQEPNGMEVDVKAKKAEHNVVLSGSIKNHDLKLLFTNTLNPFVNFKVDGHFEVEKENIHTGMDLYYGGDLRDPNNRVSYLQILKYREESRDKYSIISKNKLEINAIPLKAKADVEIDPKKLDLELAGQYMDKKGDFKLDYRNNLKKAGDYALKIEANADKNGIEILSKRDIVNPEKSNLENYISIKNFGRYELSGVVLHKRKTNDINVGAVGQLKISAADKKENINFDIGLIANTKLYSSHAKISTSKGPFLEYLMKINKGVNANGQLKLNLKDTITADGQFKVTDNDGRGNGMIIIDFKRSQRKIKSDVKFTIKDPVVNADIDLFLNFEKDNNDKIHLSTNTKNTDALTDSKNKLVYAGKKTEVNVHRSGKLSADGKLTSEIEVVLPTERVLSWKLDRELSTQDQVYNGQITTVLSDAPKRGGQASTITLKSKAINCNYDKDTLHYEIQLDTKLKDGKNLQNSITFKNIPEGEKVKMDFKSSIEGSLIPKPVNVVASNYYTKPDSLIDGASQYRLKASYGGDIGFELTGKDDVNILEKGDKKYSEENTLSIRLPFEKAHDVKLVSNVLYLQPQDKKVLAEYTIIESIQINADLYKIDANGKIGVKEGSGKVKVLVPHVDPISLNGNYKVDLEGQRKNGKVDIKANYGKGKSMAATFDAVSSDQEHTLNIKTNTPQNEKLKKLDFNVVVKTPTPDTFQANVIADMDSKVYKSDWLMVFSKAQPIFDIKYTCPNTGEVSRIYLKGNSISSSSGKVEIKIEKVYNFNLDSISEMNIQKDNLALKLQADSEKLGLKNLKVDIASKEAGSGKRLEIAATNDNKNLITGSTSFISKKEGQKSIIEGSGSVKIKEEQKSANFKFIRTLLTEGNEQGVETFLNLALGERSYVAESRVTNLEYKTSYVYCEEKKQCAHADFNSKVNLNQPGVIQHLINVGFDLRKLGLAPEFGLQINSEVSEKKLPQYSLDLHVNKESKKYHMHIYSQPEHGKFPAGITITLPQRVLALEAKMSYPVNKALPLPVQGEIVLHLDKNKPQMKTSARFMVDVKGSDKQHNGVAEFGFSHPKLGKEALIKVTGNLALPAPNTIKIETATKVSHPTLGNDRETKILFEASPSLFKILINTPVVQVIDVESKLILTDNLQQGDIRFSLLQGKPVSARVVAKDFQYYEFTTGYSDDSDRKLSIIAHLEPEKRVDISADIVLPGEKKNIAHGALYLKDNDIKSDYGVSKDNIHYFVNALKKDLSNLEGRIKQLGDKASDEFKNVVQRIQPTLKQLEKAYVDELKKLYEEVSNDQVLKELSQALSIITKFLAKLIDDVVTATKPLVDNVWNTVTETSKKIMDLYEKQIEPQIKELYNNIGALVRTWLDGLLEVVAHFTALVTDFMEKHKAELQELTNTLAEIFKDLTRLIVVQLKEFRVRSTALFNELTQRIKDLPIIELLKEKWQELTVSEQVLAMLHELHNTVRNLLPTDDIKNFADALYEYTQKKIKMAKVDDSKELRVIYEKFALALTSTIQWLRAQLNQIGLPNLINLSPSLPLLSGSSTGIPSFGGSASFSIINQLIQGDLVDPLKEFNAYRPRDWNIENELPPSLRAVVINGQHFFTFSGRHLTFPGNCRYILAHDYVNSNFTIYIQLQNGAPKAIGIIDREGTTIELKENGQVQVNGANRPLPVIEDGTYAFRYANGNLGIVIKNSAIVSCSPKLQACWVRVNGFYHGQIRGLLGVGNNEPHDDLTMPNGKVATSESEFGNSYKLSSSCATVKVPEHNHHQFHKQLPTECEMVFGGTSTLRPLALVLDVLPFRQACIHAVASSPSDGLKQACMLAEGYVSLAVSGMLPAVMPPVCLKCTDVDTPKSIGDEYEVKLPGKQADIVVTIEQTRGNEVIYNKLLVPLVSELVDELKAKQITDIKVYLIGVTSKHPFLDYYDSDLKLQSVKPRFNAESRYEETKTIRTGNPTVDEYQKTLASIIDELKYQLGAHNIVRGYERAQDLPLRPTAIKHSISLVGEKCRPSVAFVVETFRALVLHELPGADVHSHSLITVIPELSIGGGKNINQVVGFTPKAVWLLGDKKVTKESETLRASLNKPYDSCVAYADATDGIVLPQNSFLSLNADQQKSYIKTAATAITSEMLGNKIIQSCICGYHDSWSARSVCIARDV